MDEQKSTNWWHTLGKLLPYWISLGVALLIAGICCLCIQAVTSTVDQTCVNRTYYDYEVIQKLDYKNCTDVDDEGVPCSNLAEENRLCLCQVQFDVKNDIIGDVVIFYQLDTFNESITAMQPNFWQSRDNDQLRGILNNTPSAACKPYDYDERNITIVPCGAIADAMFTDILSSLQKGRQIVPSVSYGILRDKDKNGYRNPAGNLTVSFQNFSKPKSWTKHIWELGNDDENEENKGLQNEAFIAWMHTEWERKPIWRLNRTGDTDFNKGLSAGIYSVNIYYMYPPSRYNGSRTLILAREFLGEDPLCNETIVITQKAISFDIGLAGVIIGSIFLITAAGLVITLKAKDLKKMGRCSSMNVSNPPKIVVTPTSESSDISEIPPPKSKTKDEESLLKKSPNIEDNEFL